MGPKLALLCLLECVWRALMVKYFFLDGFGRVLIVLTHPQSSPSRFVHNVLPYCQYADIPIAMEQDITLHCISK